MKLSLFTLCLFCVLTFSFSASTKNAGLISAFDRYGKISWEDEKARLDNFAIQLMQEPDAIGYIYVRVGQTSCKGEAQAHAVRAKKYVTEVRRVPWGRVIWRDIGYAESFGVVIWIVPGGNSSFPGEDYRPASEKSVIKYCSFSQSKRKRHRG